MPKADCIIINDFIFKGKLISEREPLSVDDCQSVIEATIMHSGNIVEVDSVIEANSTVGVILDKTPFYAPEGGQESDTGQIEMKNLILDVREVRKIGNYIIHIGKFRANEGK